MAVKIISQAFRMIFQNAWQALLLLFVPNFLLLAVLFAIGAATGLWIGFVDPTGFEPERFGEVRNLRLRYTLAFIPTVLAAVFVNAWIAVSWQRLVLKNEPVRLFPPILDKGVWAYAGQAILIVLSIMALFFVFLFFLQVLLRFAPPEVSLQVGTVGQLGWVLLAFLVGIFVLVTPAFAAFLHLSVILTGTAVGKNLDIYDAWAKTRSHKLTIVWLAFFLTGLSLTLQTVSGLADFGSLVLNGAFHFLVGAFLMLTCVSIMTSLYRQVADQNYEDA